MPQTDKMKPSRQRLLAAAAEVFFEKGYSAARVSDVVARADVAPGTFYLYFKSKEAVFVALVEMFFKELLAETLGQNPASGLKDADAMRHQICQIWRTILVYGRTHPKMTALVLQEATALPKAERAVLAANYAKAVDALALYCRETERRGITRAVDPHLTAWVVIGMVERAVHYAIFVAAEANVDAIVADLVMIELNGLLAPPQHTENERA
jgi:AcrR family transcriptional regulator